MKIKAMTLSNGELGVVELTNTLGELQKIVGGYIEMHMVSRVFYQHNIDIVINEDGKFIEGLRPEIVILGKETNTTLDVVYGNCVFVSHDNAGNTVGLSDKQIEIVMEELKLGAMLSNKNEYFSVKTLFA